MSAASRYLAHRRSTAAILVPQTAGKGGNMDPITVLIAVLTVIVEQGIG
jgi:hypothetical protein